MGRYLPYRLHPLSVGESSNPPGPDEIFSRDAIKQYSWEDLLNLGGFPEPFLKGNVARAERWSRLRRERLTGEDVRDIRSVQDLASLNILVQLLPERVGSLLSINSLREDLDVAFGTVKNWIEALEALYYCFRIRPFSKSIKRSLKSEAKLFLYDILPIKDLGARRENLTALHLLKACHFWTDVGYGEFDLRFLRTKEKREVDFCILRDGIPWMLIECKSNRTEPSAPLLYFAKELKTSHNIQLVSKSDEYRYFAAHQTHIISYERFFSQLV